MQAEGRVLGPACRVPFARLAGFLANWTTPYHALWAVC